MVKYIIVNFLLFLTFVNMGYTSEDAGTADSFLELGVGARPLGLGGAFISIADDLNSGVWNPAGLPYIKKHEITSMHTELFLDTKFDYLAYGHNFGTYGSASLSWIRLETTGMEQTAAAFDENGDPLLVKIYGESAQKVDVTGYFNLYENSFFLSYGNSIKNINFGFSLKYIDINMLQSAYGFGLDIGMLYKFENFIKDFRIGLKIEDIFTTPVKWSGGHIDYIPQELKLGISKYWFNRRLLSSIDFYYILRKNHTVKFKAGIEFAVVPKYLIIRSGYNDGLLSFGAGLGMDFVFVDYAYILHSDLGNTHRISLSVKLQ